MVAWAPPSLTYAKRYDQTEFELKPTAVFLKIAIREDQSSTVDCDRNIVLYGTT
jgi:hypothetical protein